MNLSNTSSTSGSIPSPLDLPSIQISMLLVYNLTPMHTFFIVHIVSMFVPTPAVNIHLYLFSLSIAILCQELAPLMNGVISYSPDTKQPFDLGTVALHKCNPGLCLVGPENRTCADDNLVGVFTESAPTCERNCFCSATSSNFIAIIISISCNYLMLFLFKQQLFVIFSRRLKMAKSHTHLHVVMKIPLLVWAM